MTGRIEDQIGAFLVVEVKVASPLSSRETRYVVIDTRTGSQTHGPTTRFLAIDWARRRVEWERFSERAEEEIAAGRRVITEEERRRARADARAHAKKGGAA